MTAVQKSVRPIGEESPRLPNHVQLQCSVVEFCASCEFGSHAAFLDKSDSDGNNR